jgi:hypothetical protein
VWKEVAQMARTGSHDLPIDFGPLIEELGMERIVNTMGVKNVIETIGPKRIIKEMGVKWLLSKLSPDELKLLKEHLK